MVPIFGLYRKHPKAEFSIYTYFNCELGVFVSFVDIEKSKSPTQHNGPLLMVPCTKRNIVFP